MNTEVGQREADPRHDSTARHGAGPCYRGGMETDHARGPAGGVRIAVVAHKGGVGKTTVVANLGGAFVALGLRVLLVDCDPQGSLAAALGVTPAQPTLLEVLVGDAPIETAVRSTGVAGLSLLPAGSELTSIEDRLYGRAGWHQALRQVLRTLTEYDVTLIDTPPGLGVLSFLGILAGDSALVLCPPEFLAQRALPAVMATLDRARRIVPDLALAGILPTLVGGRSRHQQTALAELTEAYGQLVLPPAPRRAVLQDAARAGLPVTVYAPRSDAAATFTSLAGMLLEGATSPPPAT
jgi:chromosome partitioning protein